MVSQPLPTVGQIIHAPRADGGTAAYRCTEVTQTGIGTWTYEMEPVAEITDQMVTRALGVIMTPPGLRYFDDPDSVAHNREIIRRALAAAIWPDADPASDEDRIRDAMAEAQDHPGRTITR